MFPALSQLRVSCRSNKFQIEELQETTETIEFSDVTTASGEQVRQSVAFTELRTRFPGLTTQQLLQLLLQNNTSQEDAKEDRKEMTKEVETNSVNRNEVYLSTGQ